MTDSRARLFIIAILFALLGSAIVLRLGYLQVVQHDYFSVLASQTHMRKFEIPAQRGNIFMQDRGDKSPVAMNRNRKTLYADTRYIYDMEGVLRQLESILGDDYSEKIQGADGYVELEREVDYDVAQSIEELEMSGIGLSDNYVRVYPEGHLAGQVLGFVNGDGKGQYGIEEFFDNELSGQPGMFDARTDSRGIPLATDDNINTKPKPGSDVVLSIDRNIQAFTEAALEEGIEKHEADSGHAVIMEVDTGAVLGMANAPSFDPNQYGEVDDYGLFQNSTVSSQFEPGSGFKMFTMAAGLDDGVVSPGDTYEDSGPITVAGSRISNVLAPQGETSMTEVIVRSLNTGAVHVLEQLGGGEINSQAKQKLHDYFTQEFQLNQPTGIEQPGESVASMHEPDSVGQVEYANMTFGQGVATTMIRMTTSIGALVNDGTMYKPRLVDYYMDGDEAVYSQPEVLADDVVTSETSQQLRKMMQEVVEDGGGYGTQIEGYKIGGKTGTAEIPHPDGGYYEDRYIGTFTGFAPVDDPKYVMTVRLDNPRSAGYAGNQAAEVFGDIMRQLIGYGGIPPAD